MNIQNKKPKQLHSLSESALFLIGLWLLIMPVTQAWSSGTAITNINFSSLVGDKVLVELDLDGLAETPKVFQTDNPARIALDFVGVSSGLSKKMFAVNQGAVNTVYVVEASGRTRVVINLAETVPYETIVAGNKFSIVLKPIGLVNSVISPSKQGKIEKRIASFLPKQTIKNIDFRRGEKGEGRLVLELSAPNTVVDVKEVGGKVVLNFLNTKLPKDLQKSYDVSDFATPVRKIDAKVRGAGVNIIVTPNNGNYDYSSYQSNGLLIVDFVPLTAMEKEELLKKKFPYVGKKLTLNFQDIEVRSVLQILADFTELNIIAADTVSGNVTLRLNDVPWDQALDLILKSKGLSKRQTGNVILIAPTAEIIKIEEDELASKQIEEQLEPLRTEYIQINYAKAEEIQMLLVGSNVVKSESEGSSTSQDKVFGGGANATSNRSSSSRSESEIQGVLSARGSSTVDARTNTIIVKDTAKQLEQVREMIRILDIPVRQVMIEARIVVADNNFAQEIGVKFGIAKEGDLGSGKTFGFNGGGENVAAGAIGSSALLDLGANAIAAHPVGALGMTLARAADYVLNLELSALENENRGEVLANPRVMTSDRELAYIKQGVQIPYESTSGEDGTTTELVDAVLELNVLPQITPDGDVIMELLIKKDAPQPGTNRIQKREIETLVRVRDGETIVLGGVYEGDSAQESFKIPFLGDIPYIKHLFRKDIQSDRKRELLIFVTPKIIKDSLSAR